MHSMTDSRRLSPQTTSSSGYHSDLSSTNHSPQSITTNNEQSNSFEIEKKTNKKSSRLSTFLRKQYERAKSKLLSPKQSSPSSSSSIATCSKATSTTQLAYLSENNNQIKPRSSTIYKRSSFIEPVRSIYVQPLPPSQRVLNNSYRRLVTQSNYDNMTMGYSSNNPYKYSYNKTRYPQNYYPYRYLNKQHSNLNNRLTYVPLSDFITSRNSAFKPIRTSHHSTYPLYEQINFSDDPCDLEVAQYFHQNLQYNHRNYFDMPNVLTKKTCNETLC